LKEIKLLKLKKEMSFKFEIVDSILDEIILEIIGKKAAFLTETPKEVVAETPKEIVEEKTEEVVSTIGTEAEKVEAKNGEAEAEKEVAEKETEEVVSTNGTEAKEDVVEAKNGEAEAKKDEDKNGHENGENFSIFRL
jgi:hypothetical protein